MMRYTRGFTLVEVLVVITVLLIIITFSFFAIREFAFNQQIQAAEQTLTTLFREVRQKTVAAESDERFGLLFSTSTITRFEGESSTSTPERHMVTHIPNVVLTTTLSADTNEIYFSRLSGRPSATGTIQVYGIHTGNTRTFYIADNGLLLPEQ